jgi:hypothetical protein
MSNILDAIMNIVNDGSFEAKRTKDTENSMNGVGVSLEEYVKDAFSNSFGLEGVERKEAMKEIIIYHGNESNPPDIIIGGKDEIVVEVKKSDSYRAELQLNSSIPHSKFDAKDSRITKECENRLSDRELDMLYVVGAFKTKKQIRHLAMVYGSIYCAEKSRYETIDSIVRSKIKELSNILSKSFPTVQLDTETNELGKLKNIDTKGYCDLRIRGMYTYASPYVVFNEEFKSRKSIFDLFAVIPDDIFQKFGNKEKFLEFAKNKKGFTIERTNYPDPNDSNKYVACQKIIYIKNEE